MQNTNNMGYYSQPQNQISSFAVNPQANSNNNFYLLEQEIGAQVSNVNHLIQTGKFTQHQGQKILAQLAQKAQQLEMYKNSNYIQNPNFQTPQQVQIPQMQSEEVLAQTPMDLFNLERPGFFDGDGRGNVLNYIRDLSMDKDEILRIAQLVEDVENSAIKKYLKKTAYEKSLNDENKLAKSRLTAYAQNAPSDSNMNRIFTREQIGAMSGEEFTQNEKLIMEQLKQGLIK